MKRNIKYILTNIFILSAFALVLNSCSSKYDYKVDYSRYDAMTLEVGRTVDNTLSIDINNMNEYVIVNHNIEGIELNTNSFIYTLSNSEIADIAIDGSIKPKKVGTSDLKVTFRGNNKIFTECKITITREIIKVSAIKIPANINNLVQEGKTLNLAPSIVVIPSNADNPVLSYKSQDVTIATVDEDGVVTGMKEGSTKITVTSTDGTNITAECEIHVVGLIKVTEIRIPDITKRDTIGMNQTINLGASIEIIPEQASNKEVKYEITEGSGVITIDVNGVIKTKTVGKVKILVSALDGSGITKEFAIVVDNRTDLFRPFWKVTTSHNIPADAAISNAPSSLIDGNNTTCLSMVKPGKSYNEIPLIPATDIVYFVIDKGNNDEFNYFWLRHRNATTTLRAWAVSFYGSNDGENFTEIQKGVVIPGAQVAAILESGNVSLPATTYRYVKVTYDDYHKTTSSSIQIAEFRLGKN